MNALEAAIDIGKRSEVLYDGPTLKRALANLVQYHQTTVRDHARELREVKAELERSE